MLIKSFTIKLINALKLPLPGTDVQWEMASSDRLVSDYPRSRRKDSKLAAVLILLYPHKDKISTLLIQRPQYNGVHSGQISFPGGKREEGDTSAEDTALREAEEEAGILQGSVHLAGRLTPLFIPVSNIEVTPVVGICEMRPDFKPCSHEVVHLIETDLDKFNPRNVKTREMKIRNESINILYYDIDGYVVWGATAMLIRELMAIIENYSIPLRRS